MKNKASLVLAIVCVILIGFIYINKNLYPSEAASVVEETSAETNENLDETSESLEDALEPEIKESFSILEEQSIPAPSGVVPVTTETPDRIESKMLVTCDNTMIEGKEYNLLACVFQEDIKDEIIKEIAESNQITVAEVANNSKVKSVTITNRFVVTIIYDKEDFELLSDTESFQGNYKNKKQWFEWFVKPINTGTNKHISIRVENIDAEGNKYTSIPAERITIDVAVDKSGFFDNMWIQIRDNAEWTMTVLIIPVISYLFGLFRRRKEEDVEE